MKKIKLFSTLTLASLLTLSLAAGCGANKQAQPGATDTKKKLVMATSADYFPYEYHDTSGGKDQIVGFDIDIAKQITKDLGYELEIKDMDFNGLLPALQTGRVDFVMAGMTPNPERLKNADFSSIYYEAKNTIVSKKGSSLKTPADLKGKKVGVQLGSIQEEEAKKMEGVTVVPLNKIPEIVQEIKSNRIDAAIIEDTVAKGYTSTNADLEFTTIPNTEAAGSAVAFPKGSKQVDAFNKALQKLKDSGDIDKLIKKWFEEAKK